MAKTGSNNPAPGISNFLLQVYGDSRATLLDFAAKHGLGVDVSDFISQQLLDDPAQIARLIDFYKTRFPDISGPITFHAALWDLAPSARDSLIRTATMQRMTQCLDIAEQLGIPEIVFHLDFFPLARAADYLARWTDRQAAFWRELLVGRHVNLLLENTWEPRAQIVRDAVDSVGLPNVGACLDIPHVHLNSRESPADWVEALGPRLRCIHLSDNDGSASQHLPPGQGTIDWPAVLRALTARGLSLPAVIEVPGLAGAQATIDYLHTLHV